MVIKRIHDAMKNWTYSPYWSLKQYPPRPEQIRIINEIRKQKEKKEMDRSDEELFAELKAGDYVVHEVHGRGRYLGLKTMEAAGTVGEYLELEYRDGDRLFITTSQIGRIQKYIGSEDGEPMLSRLGGKEWESAKSKARESVKKLAFDLVELYSGRYGNAGYAFGHTEQL